MAELDHAGLSRWQKIKILFSLMCCVGMIAVFVFGWQQGWLQVRTITCSADHGECPEYVVAELNKLKGSLITDNANVVVERIPHFLPSFRAAEVTKKWPDTIEVHFRTAEVRYAVSAANKEPLLVDESGIVISSQSDDPDIRVPSVQLPDDLYGRLVLRESFPAELHSAILTLFGRLTSEHIEGVNITILDGQQLKVVLGNGHTYFVAVETTQRAAEQIVYVEKNWSQIPNTVSANEIDLRFHYPVLKSDVPPESP